MTEHEKAMAASERWVVCLETGALWLHERVGADAAGRIVTRDELRSSYPALFAELKRTDFRDTPRIVKEPRR
jgi:hypothetical protein